MRGVYFLLTICVTMSSSPERRRSKERDRDSSKKYHRHSHADDSRERRDRRRKDSSDSRSRSRSGTRRHDSSSSNRDKRDRSRDRYKNDRDDSRDRRGGRSGERHKYDNERRHNDNNNSENHRRSRFSTNDDRQQVADDHSMKHSRDKFESQRYSSTSGNQVISDALVAASSKSKRQRSDELPSDKIRWGKDEELSKEEEEEKRLKEASKEPQYKPDFGLSGALAKDERTGNVVNGVVLKFTEPYEAAKPDKHWRLYVYKGDEIVETLYIHRRSCFLFGRETKVADVPLMHPSVSAQHAVIQYREIDEMVVNDEGDRDVVKVVKPYLMDLKSTHGTKLNGEKIDDSRYYELRMGDLIQFGQSSRDYVLMHDKV